MNIPTHFEDLSNEIFFIIFDYLFTPDIFFTFTSLNQRISYILQSIPLRIIIPTNSYHRQIEFLSSHLIFHDHQVISLLLYDASHHDSNIINVLFTRHNFINLQCCRLISSCPISKFDNVMKQIKSLKKLAVIGIYQRNYENMSEKDKYDITEMVLMHQSPYLHSILLQYPYDYSDISNYTSISSNLKSLKLSIISSTTVIYSILSVFRYGHTIQYLGIKIENQSSVVDNNVSVSIETPFINDDDFSLLNQMKCLDLTICVICDSRLISYILRCMPNLKYFYFNHSIQLSSISFPVELLNGYVWYDILECYAPYLSKFEFHMLISKQYPRLNLDIIMNSFECLIRKYPNWNIIINRWKYQKRTEHVVIRTFNYHKRKLYIYMGLPCINCETLETRSTMITTNNQHIFYSDIKRLNMFMTGQNSTINWSSPLFEHIELLVIKMPKTPSSSLWNNIWNIITFRPTNDSPHQCVIRLAQIVYLPMVTRIQFQSNSNLSCWKDIQFILQRCPKLTCLMINTRLLLLSELIDNPLLFQIYEQIQGLNLVTEKDYFPLNCAFKLVQRFSSIIHIELYVLLFGNIIKKIRATTTAEVQVL